MPIDVVNATLHPAAGGDTLVMWLDLTPRAEPHNAVSIWYIETDTDLLLNEDCVEYRGDRALKVKKQLLLKTCYFIPSHLDTDDLIKLRVGYELQQDNFYTGGGSKYTHYMKNITLGDVDFQRYAEPPPTPDDGWLNGTDPDTIEAEDLELMGLQHYMLDLINEERAAAGLGPVTLGNNTAAQLHAENMLEHCFLSHWGLDGLKPYMRYVLANGTQYDAENVSGHGYCINSGRYVTIEPRDELADTMNGLMNSAGHRDNILDPHHSRVNIGVAYNEYQLWAVQHFEYDYMVFNQPPTIKGTILSLSGRVVNGSSISSDDDLGIQVSYDSPPHNLTRGQVQRTYCYDAGIPVASIVSPPPPGYYYIGSSSYITHIPCANPYDVDPEAVARTAPPPGHITTTIPILRTSQIYTVPFIEAIDWVVDRDHFKVRANIDSVLQKHGPGVYTVTIWGKVASQDTVVGQGVIFHHVMP